MPIDMPPRPVYHVERAAPTPDDGVFAQVARAARAVSERFRQSAMAEPSPAERMLPPIDPRSAALTREDRLAMVAGLKAVWGDGDMSNVRAPDSYVGDRIRAASAFAGAQAAMRAGTLDSEDAREVNCRMVGVAMDRRAGAYVQGGEVAAEAARRSIAPEQLQRCREAVAAAKTRGQAPTPVPIKALAVKPAVKQPEPARIDFPQPSRVRIDLPQPKSFVIDLSPPGRVRPDLAQTAGRDR